LVESGQVPSSSTQELSKSWVMFRTLSASVYLTVKQLICLSSVLCLLTLTACTKAEPTLKSLSSEIDGLQLSPAEPTFYSATGSLQIAGVCDARITKLHISIDGGEMMPLTEHLDSGSNQIDCSQRTLNFAVPKALLNLNDDPLADTAPQVRKIKIVGDTDFGAKPWTEMSVTFIKDVAKPVVTLSANTKIKKNEDTAYNVRGSCESPYPVNLRFGSLSASAPCLLNEYSAVVNVTSEPDALAINLSAEQTDAAGNISVPTAMAVWKDTVAPLFDITSYEPKLINSANVGTLKFSGYCERGLLISIVSPAQAAKTYPCPVGPGSTFTLTDSPYDISQAPDTDTPFMAVIQQTDAIGNTTSKSLAFDYKDTLRGLITNLQIVLPQANATNTFKGNCLANQGNVTVELKQGSAASVVLPGVPCIAGAWIYGNQTITSFAEGTVNVSVYQTDNHANKSDVVPGSFVIDRTPPNLTFTTYDPVINLADSSLNQTVSGDCENGSSISFSVNNGVSIVTAPNTVCTASRWTAVVSYAGVVAATTSTTYTVESKDTALNLNSVSKTITVDIVKPVVTIIEPSTSTFVNLANVSAFRFKGACTLGNGQVKLTIQTLNQLFDCVDDGTGNGIYDGVLSLNTSAIPDGENSFSLVQTDSANNSGQALSSVFKDVIRPTAPTSLGDIVNTDSNVLDKTPTFSPSGGSEIPSTSPYRSGFSHYKIAYREKNGATDISISGNIAPGNSAAVAAATGGLSASKVYTAYAFSVDAAGNYSLPYTEDWDYCPARTIVIRPEGPNVDQGGSPQLFDVPRSCKRGNIVVHARGEAGRLVNGSYAPKYGGGGIASALLSGDLVAGKKLIVKFAGAGLGGGAMAGGSINANSGGRYAWVTNSDTNLLQLVAGGGGGTATADITSFNLPGVGGDRGLGEGDCESTYPRREYCGRNGNNLVEASFFGAAGAAGKTATVCPGDEGSPGVYALSASASAGFGGNAGNKRAGKEAGGGGGGYGGGGAGGGGRDTNCNGRSGGGGGSYIAGSSVVSSTALGLYAGQNHGLPEVRITIGLPKVPCPSGYTFIPPNGTPTNSTGAGGLSGELGFCVANYEAYVATAGGPAASSVNKLPTSSLSRASAANACAKNTNPSGVGKLPSNLQWQAVANIVHWNETNWELKYPGQAPDLSKSNSLSVGVTRDSRPSRVAVETESSNPCYGTTSGGSCPTTWSLHKRTHDLGNGTTIWDMGGNLTEWVEDGAPSISGANYYVSRLNMNDAGAEGTAWSFFAPSADYSVNYNQTNYYGLGKILADVVASPSGVVRGGSANFESNASGIFAGSIKQTPSIQDPDIGFRCVFDFAAPGF
jgi:formylglycine-generating enzyme required for sulfatase activity